VPNQLCELIFLPDNEEIIKMLIIVDAELLTRFITDLDNSSKAMFVDKSNRSAWAASPCNYSLSTF